MQNITELRNEVKAWSEREDISDDQLDQFIRMCEQEYKDDLFLPPNEKGVILATDADGRIPIPTDYLKTKHMYVLTSDGLKKPLYRKPNEYVVAVGSITGVGTSYFERQGNYFIFAPAPGEGQDVYITYYAVIPSMIDVEEASPGASNFVLSIMPTIYLFGTLMFLHMFTYNEDRANYYAALYERAKQDLIDMQNEAEMSGSSLHIVPSMSDEGTTW